MSIELRNAPSLVEPQGYSHVSIAHSGPLVHLAGQGGHRADGTLAKGLAAQTEQALLNVAAALDAAGATTADLVKLVILVVGWNETMLSELASGLQAASRVRAMPLVPTTLVGVQSLFFDNMLIEIEGVAVLAAKHGGPTR